MMVPAVGLVLLPTYATLGLAATFLLVILRLLQGLSVGGELVGAITYALESCPSRSRYFLGALIQISGSVGGLLATGVIASAMGVCASVEGACRTHALPTRLQCHPV